MYCLNMLAIALELARSKPAYEDVATKFFEHFIYIANAIHDLSGAGVSLWDPEDGFYYDFDLEAPITDEDLLNIEAKMQEIIDEKIDFVKEKLSKDEAIKLFTSLGEDYKVELIHEIDENEVTVYKNNDFIDLCRGPHVENTGNIKAFKLLSIAGAYWHGNECNKMLPDY